MEVEVKDGEDNQFDVQLAKNRQSQARPERDPLTRQTENGSQSPAMAISRSQAPPGNGMACRIRRPKVR